MADKSASRPVLRLDFPTGARLGPGKIRLLELVADEGSIAAAGRVLGMSYRRAWLLIDELNRIFSSPLVTTQHGGKGGGAAVLTELGQDVIRRFRAIEAATAEIAAKDLAALESSLSADYTP